MLEFRPWLILSQVSARGRSEQVRQVRGLKIKAEFVLIKGKGKIRRC